MNNSIKVAIEDIAVIKGVIERTQKDFTKVANFFVWIGFLNVISVLCEQVGYCIRNISGYNSTAYLIIVNINQLLFVIGYGIIYAYFYKKIKREKNDISIGMIKVWGIVLIGSQLIMYFYIWLLPAENNDITNTLWRSKELIMILPIVVALFMTGILTQRKLITFLTSIYCVVYFALFVSMKEVEYGNIGGIFILIPISSISIKIVMIFGMIALGLFLKRGVVLHGDKFDTGRISE